MRRESQISIIERGLYDFLFEFASDKIPGTHSSEKCSYVISEIPKFCNVFGINFSDAELHEEMKKIDDIYRGKKMSFTVILDPSTKPAGMNEFLLGRGFKKTATGYGKIINLGRSIGKKNPARLKIDTVMNETGLSTWLDIVKNIFNFTDDQRQILCAKLMKKAFRENKFDLYTGFLNDLPVCSGAVYKGKTSAVIYWISTVPDMRRKGLATEMMEHLLAEIKKSGYEYSSLQSSSMAYGLYKKIRYIHCCDFDFYSRT